MKKSNKRIVEKKNKLHCDYEKISSHIVMVGDLNAGHSLFGGLLVKWVDEAASVYVMSTLKTRAVVTKKISEVIYDEPTHLGDILEIFLRVRQVGHTSLTVDCVVRAKQIELHEKTRTILNCSLVFVKVDSKGRPAPHHLRIEDLLSEQLHSLDAKSK